MARCCDIGNESTKVEMNFSCFKCGDNGKPMKSITLKSLLAPEALAKLEPKTNYKMCTNHDCPVVYFNEVGSLFLTADVKIPVFQKVNDKDSPVCYCFGWTKSKLKSEIEQTGTSTAVSSISEHIKAGRCGCEVNNPEGSCCLGNVKKVLDSLTKS